MLRRIQKVQRPHVGWNAPEHSTAGARSGRTRKRWSAKARPTLRFGDSSVCAPALDSTLALLRDHSQALVTRAAGWKLVYAETIARCRRSVVRISACP